jgi:hypothetical protein
MPPPRRLKLALFVIPPALFLAGAQHVMQPASAQGEDGMCGMPASKRACDMTGFKVLTNPNTPALMVLQIETKEGPRRFIASRVVMERFAKELVQATEKAQREKL